MKKIWLSALILLGSLSYVFVISSVTSTSKAEEIASSDESSITNQDNPLDDFQKSKELSEKFDFQQVSSCKSFEEVVRVFIQTYRDLPRSDETGTTASFLSVKESQPETQRSSNDIVDASVQIGGSDEPDIVAGDGNIFYYANTEKNKISIIQLSGGDTTQAKIIQEVPLPQGYKYTKLFLWEHKLVVLADSFGKTVSIYSSGTNQTGATVQTGITTTGSNQGSGASISGSIDRFGHIVNNNESVHVLVFDVSNIPTVKLERFFDLKGSLIDTRILSGTMYVISKMSIDRYKAAYQRTGLDIDAGDFLPTKREVVIVGGKKIEKDWLSDSISNIKCNEVFYNMPSEELLTQYPKISPQVIALSKISLQSPEEETKVKVLLGNVEGIYLSPTSLYTENSFYTIYPFWCKDCFWGSTYNAGQNTLIHKFDIKDDLVYKKSAILPGIPLTQRSLDEDKDGYLRIVTKDPKTQLSSNFITMTPSLDFYSTVQDIQPARPYSKIQYFGEHLYLSSEKPSDPRVVIDLENSHKPRNLGELPLYGSPVTLYPYQPISGQIQYLLGIGNDPTKLWGSGDMRVHWYQVNFAEKETIKSKCGSLVVSGVDETTINSCSSSSKKCSAAQLAYETCANAINIKNIKSELLDSISFGGDAGYSESVEDARAIIIHSGMITLPITSQQEQLKKVCGKIGCLTELKYQILFNGIKTLQTDPITGITEIGSKDYKDELSGAITPPRLILNSGNVVYFTSKFVEFYNPLTKVENILRF